MTDKIQNGDTLLIAINHPVSREQADKMKEKLAESMPGVNVVIVSDCAGFATVADVYPGRKAS